MNNDVKSEIARNIGNEMFMIMWVLNIVMFWALLILSANIVPLVYATAQLFAYFGYGSPGDPQTNMVMLLTFLAGGALSMLLRHFNNGGSALKMAKEYLDTRRDELQNLMNE